MCLASNKDKENCQIESDGAMEGPVCPRGRARGTEAGGGGNRY